MTAIVPAMKSDSKAPIKPSVLRVTVAPPMATTKLHAGYYLLVHRKTNYN
jgi:hypothetical protein